MEPLLGEIRMFAGNFAPRGWEFCDGQLLKVSENPSLFSILGTIYGGDGRTTFGLPDLRGRAPIHEGQGPGLENRRLGSRGGHETTTLHVTNLPSHSHTLRAYSGPGNSSSPEGAVSAAASPNSNLFSSETPNATMNSEAIAPTGQGQAFSNMSPYLAVTFIIATTGLYPSRD